MALCPGALRQVRGEVELPLGIDGGEATRGCAASKEQELGAVDKGACNGRHGGGWGLLLVVVFGEADLGPGRGAGDEAEEEGEGDEGEGEEAAHSWLACLIRSACAREVRGEEEEEE